MSDTISAASLLYPSSAPAAAPSTTPAPAASQPPSAAALIYGSRDEKTQNAPGTAPVVATPAPASQPSGPDASALYGDVVPGTAHIRWDEPAASSSAIKLTAPDGIDDHMATAEGQLIIAGALSAAGAGPTVAAELYSHAASALRPGYAPSSAAASEAALRSAWGSSYERNLSGVRAAVQAAAAKDPSLPAFLDRTGLGNDPRFIRLIAARVARNGRR